MSSFGDFYDKPKLYTLYEEYKSFDSMKTEDLFLNLSELGIITVSYKQIMINQLKSYSDDLNSEKMFFTVRLDPLKKRIAQLDKIEVDDISHEETCKIISEFDLEVRMRKFIFTQYRKYFTKILSSIIRKFPLRLLILEDGEIINILSFLREGKDDISLSFPQKLYNSICYLKKYIRDEDHHYNISGRLMVNILHMKPTNKAFDIYRITTDSPQIRIQKILSEAIVKHVNFQNSFTVPFIAGIGFDKFNENESDINDYVVSKFVEFLLTIFPQVTNSQLFNIALRIVSIPIEERVERVEFIIEYMNKCSTIEGTQIKNVIDQYKLVVKEESEMYKSSDILPPEFQSLGPSNYTNMRGDVESTIRSNLRNSISFNLRTQLLQDRVQKEISINSTNSKFNRIRNGFIFESSTFIADIIPIFDLNMKMIKHYIQINPSILEHSWFLSFANILSFLSEEFAYNIIDAIHKCYTSTTNKTLKDNFVSNLMELIRNEDVNTKTGSFFRRGFHHNDISKLKIFDSYSDSIRNILHPQLLLKLNAEFIEMLFNISCYTLIDQSIILKLTKLEFSYVKDITLLYGLNKSRKLFDKEYSFFELINMFLECDNMFTRIGKMLTFKYLFNQQNICYEIEVINKDYKTPILTYIDISELNIYANIKKYKETIDVHDDDRDERTDRGVATMISMYNLTPEDVIQEFGEFWEYANMLPEHSRKIFDRIMGFNKDMELIERIDNDYNGFLTEETMVEETNYDPKFIIANFWRFCKEFPREGLADAFFAGIMRSYQMNTIGEWYCVCIPGKLQNMAISTIQGRIIVDGEPLTIDDIDKFNNVKHIKLEEKSPAFIYKTVQPFIVGMSNGTPPLDANDFYRQLFEFINGYNPDITCEEATRILTLYAEKDGFDVYPSLSVASAFENSIDTEEYTHLVEQVKFLIQNNTQDDWNDDDEDNVGDWNYDDEDNVGDWNDYWNEDNEDRDRVRIFNEQRVIQDDILTQLREIEGTIVPIEVEGEVEGEGVVGVEVEKLDLEIEKLDLEIEKLDLEVEEVKELEDGNIVDNDFLEFLRNSSGFNPLRHCFLNENDYENNRELFSDTIKSTNDKFVFDQVINSTPSHLIENSTSIDKDFSPIFVSNPINDSRYPFISFDYSNLRRGESLNYNFRKSRITSPFQRSYIQEIDSVSRENVVDVLDEPLENDEYSTIIDRIDLYQRDIPEEEDILRRELKILMMRRENLNVLISNTLISNSNNKNYENVRDLRVLNFTISGKRYELDILVERNIEEHRIEVERLKESRYERKESHYKINELD